MTLDQRDAKTTFQVTAETKQAILHRCALTDMSMNDLIVGWIADRVGQPFEPEGRRTTARPGAGAIMLRVPAPVHKALQHRLVDDGQSLQAWITGLLEDELSKPFTRIAA